MLTSRPEMPKVHSILHPRHWPFQNHSWQPRPAKTTEPLQLACTHPEHSQPQMAARQDQEPRPSSRRSHNLFFFPSLPLSFLISFFLSLLLPSFSLPFNFPLLLLDLLFPSPRHTVTMRNHNQPRAHTIRTNNTTHKTT